MLHLRLLLESTEAPTESNLDGRYQPKAAPELLRLKELAGLRQGALRKFPRNEQCQPRLAGRSRPHKRRGGPRSSAGRKRLEKSSSSLFAVGWPLTIGRCPMRPRYRHRPPTESVQS